jgi:hypothetical protein
MEFRKSMMVCVALLSVTIMKAEAAEALFVFDQPQPAPIAGLKIDDQRSQPKKSGFLGLKTKTVTYLEDVAFSPSPVSLFESALASVYTVAPQQVVLKTFAVADFYPVRMGFSEGEQGGLLKPASMEKELPAAAKLLGPPPANSDFIVCMIEAEVDGRLIAAAAMAPYRGKQTAFRVYKDPAVVAAVKQAVSDAVRGWTERAKAP